MTCLRLRLEHMEHRGRQMFLEVGSTIHSIATVRLHLSVREVLNILLLPEEVVDLVEIRRLRVVEEVLEDILATVATAEHMPMVVPVVAQVKVLVLAVPAAVVLAATQVKLHHRSLAAGPEEAVVPALGVKVLQE